jgi:hypothetical protein
MIKVYDKSGDEINNGDFLICKDKGGEEYFAVTDIQEPKAIDGSILISKNDLYSLNAIPSETSENYKLRTTYKISEDEYLQYIMEK